MPWSGHLYVGLPYKTEAEGLALCERFKLTLPANHAEHGIIGAHGERFLYFRGKRVPVTVEVMEETEGGTHSRAVGFPLTRRYRGALLDQDEPHGRPDLFIVDPMEMFEIMAQVRAWWPEARTFLWDRHT